MIIVCRTASPGQTLPENHAAIHLTAGLGIDGYSSTSLFSYLNTLYGIPYAQKLGGLAPATEFFIRPEFQASDNFMLGMEYSYLLYSQSVSGYYSGEVTEVVHLPMLTAHYVLRGEGYWVKFGGGAGYQLGTLKQTINEVGSEQQYTAHGFGVKLDAALHLAFDEHLYGMLGGDVRWCTGSTFQKDGADAAYESESPKLNFITLGLKLGMMYQF